MSSWEKRWADLMTDYRGLRDVHNEALNKWDDFLQWLNEHHPEIIKEYDKKRGK